MEELPLDFLEELEKEKPKAKKSKILERTHRVWFYEVPGHTHLGQCDNPDCIDKRNKPQVMVWTNQDGLNMCRYCFLDGWLEDA